MGDEISGAVHSQSRKSALQEVYGQKPPRGLGNDHGCHGAEIDYRSDGRTERKSQQPDLGERASHDHPVDLLLVVGTDPRVQHVPHLVRPHGA